MLLRAPNGYGTDLIWLRGILYGDPTLADGDNFINTVIDEQATDDLNQTVNTDAPFTDSWKPSFNSTVWSMLGDPRIFPDAVGQLGRLNGQSTQGTWTILVADNFSQDTGTLNSWSLMVTPKAFSCAAFTPVAAVSGTKTASGTTVPVNPR